jgi:hypothetical protein
MSVVASQERVQELLAIVGDRIAPSGASSCRIVSAHAKLTKIIFEVECDGRLLIGKASKSERAKHTHGTLRMLWDAGLRPPSPWTVSEPVAWVPEHGLLLQAKAEGDMLLSLIEQRSPRAVEGVIASAGWIRRLQGLSLAPEPAADLASVVERCRRELAGRLPRHAARIGRLSETLLAHLTEAPERTVSSHGDFHPMNVFFSASGRLTAIDLDTFAAREPAADIGYFVAQLAIMCNLSLGDLQVTRGLRTEFLHHAPQVNPDRIDVHVRLAFLRTLHYDLCILRLTDGSKVDRFLNVVEHGLEP